MSHARKFAFRIFALLLLLGLSARPVRGQTGITLEDPKAIVKFGETITFQAKLKTPLAIRQATLLFRSTTQDTTYVENVEIAEDGSVNFVYDASLNTFPPFSKAVFWFQVTLADNQQYTSEPQPFTYDDTRFPWRATQRANVTVHWYAGNDDVSANALEMAAAGMMSMRKLVEVSLTDPLHIYVYANPADLQTTMLLGGREWAGGQAISETGVMLVAIAPDAPKSEYAAKVPHEMTHVLLYRALGREKYASQPVWFLEGLASMMEQSPNPEYDRALMTAVEKGALISFDKLCKSFPPDTGGVYLAYAQSQSFVKFIYESYGATGLAMLLSAYGDGMNCELGTPKALGISLAQLDAQWRESVLKQNVLGVAIRNLSPFALIMALVSIVPLWGMIDLLRQRRKRDEQYAQKPIIR